jgi:hypothetical protein
LWFSSDPSDKCQDSTFIGPQAPSSKSFVIHPSYHLQTEKVLLNNTDRKQNNPEDGNLDADIFIPAIFL